MKTKTFSFIGILVLLLGSMTNGFSDEKLVIKGYDPVAYFTEGKPVSGRPELELSLSGTVWLFRNEGNRAAFAAHPEVYTPQFGGYDSVAIMRGASVPGHPLVWVVAGSA